MKQTGKKGKRLRKGFTTGSASAAAAKAALLALCTPQSHSQVEIPLLPDGRLTIPIAGCEKKSHNQIRCWVIKDAGDDPDITHKAEIGATVQITSEIVQTGSKIEVIGGFGVGRITKPGLELPVGSAAINPGPLHQICKALEPLLEQYKIRERVIVSIDVPKGPELARKTLNPRLGIIGGISILGTTGIVNPLSHESYRATIRSSISVAAASGTKNIVLTTGRRSERLIRQNLSHLTDESFIQIGDYFQFSMETAALYPFSRIVIAAFFGKILKMACGHGHTHARVSRLSLESLYRLVLENSLSDGTAMMVKQANTARHAFDILKTTGPLVLTRTLERAANMAYTFNGNKIPVDVYLFDFNSRMFAKESFPHKNTK
ncbi:cobalt-precorrin-5B (C(1))-methyltransferase CbiD [Desulfobacterales bacterium HSG17]|nr:cobalt-precorrin-5B (C(1))-methyltransferase CbiD [Desulfobacterales bacterium HSG17]